ncbi:hypothetical protein KR51_00019270 [Rubidibacter lacunae KORDI 51-2]|uniref:Uncharacterized protein n=1 Tax=Rubidibacter lacunae KORDI 51-2 TaxID=582515 RepID=U5DNS6_9CHRO|nr:hypothetical protein KR51_00019270 [Rubidibacter lacunae KORDI 51-2]
MAFNYSSRFPHCKLEPGACGTIVDVCHLDRYKEECADVDGVRILTPTDSWGPLQTQQSRDHAPQSVVRGAGD